LFRGHFQPRGQYTPECRKGLGQDVSSADEIGIARVIAGDTSKTSPSRLRRSSSPQAGHVREVPLGSTAIGKTRFSDARHSPLPHPPIGPRGGGFAEVLASGFAIGLAFIRSSLRSRWQKGMPRQLLDVTYQKWWGNSLDFTQKVGAASCPRRVIGRGLLGAAATAGVVSWGDRIHPPWLADSASPCSIGEWVPPAARPGRGRGCEHREFRLGSGPVRPLPDAGLLAPRPISLMLRKLCNPAIVSGQFPTGLRADPKYMKLLQDCHAPESLSPIFFTGTCPS
jgi:hypothetical protein